MRTASIVLLLHTLLCACGGSEHRGSLDASADARPQDAEPDAMPDAAVAPAADPVGFSSVGELSAGRNALTATLLDDGRVLLVGGELISTRSQLAAVDIFDPATGEMSEAAPLPEARANHVAVRLDDGRVLVVGGGRSAPIGAGSGLEVRTSAVVYDPTRDAWQETGSPSVGRSHFGAVRLDDGRVLVAGGASGAHENGSICTGARDCGPLGDTLGVAEIYDPATGLFTVTGSMREARSLFTLTRLLDGRVAAVGGMNDRRVGFSSSEVFDSAMEAFAPGPRLVSEERIFHAAALLPSGRLLVGGGKLPDTRFLATVNVVDVATGEVQLAQELPVPITLARFVALASGRVLSVGGFRCPSPCGPIADAAIFDEETGAWAPIGSLETARAGHTVTRLADGRVLVCGGFSNYGNVRDCELTN